MARPFLLVVCLAACGGVITGSHDAGDGGDAETSADAASDGGWTTCRSPDGFAVCDGPNQCDPAQCANFNSSCPFQGMVSDDVVRACGNALQVSGAPCEIAPDGLICYQADPRPAGANYFTATAFDVGVLLTQNGGSDFVRYADFGLWTGDPLPEPVTCPTLQNAIICGGNCGGCSYNAVCHGRSPLHPWGFCLPLDTKYACNPSKGQLCQDPTTKCFAFKVQDAGQDLADANAMCLPKDMCDDLAANLPGGAICE